MWVVAAFSMAFVRSSLYVSISSALTLDRSKSDVPYLLDNKLN